MPMPINKFMRDWAENICLSWVSGFSRLKSNFRDSGANSKPNCIQLLISFTPIATPTISRPKEKNNTSASVSTSSRARAKGCPMRASGSAIICWKRCMLVSAVNKAISLKAVSTNNLPTSWLCATWPFLRWSRSFLALAGCFFSPESLM